MQTPDIPTYFAQLGFPAPPYSLRFHSIRSANVRFRPSLHGTAALSPSRRLHGRART